MSLKEYRRKRDFRKTREPRAGLGQPSAGGRFVIQKHDASRLHYDFRLEIDHALKSWAVPKGIPFDRGEKRLAVQVEDHPVSYIDFEGTIPAGQYGAGTVMVWDQGTFTALGASGHRALDQGKLHFELNGAKLHGQWSLVRMRQSNQWLLIRGGDDMRPVAKRADDTSVLSGKSMKELSADGEAAPEKPRRTRNKKAGKPPSARTRTPNRQKVFPSVPPRQRRRSPSTAGFFGFVEPMKARLVKSPPPAGWLYEVKFDGFRGLALKDSQEVRLLSRNQNDLGGRFPEIVEALRSLKADRAVIDGEIVALDPEGRSAFQLLQADEFGEQRPPIFFYVFDLLYLDGENLQSQPLTHRKSVLQKLVHDPQSVIRYSASLGENADGLLQKARALHLEGLIGKREDSTYEPGRRSGAWIKLKLHAEQEFVIGGYTDPQGSRAHFGALLVGYYEHNRLKFAGKVGTGFDERRLRSLYSQFAGIPRRNCPFVNLPERNSSGRAPRLTAARMKRCHWLEPHLVCELKFAEWTRDAKLRQPVFVGLRDDKDPRQVVREEPA